MTKWENEFKVLNTIGTGTYSSVWRQKFRSAMLQSVLRSAVVAEAVCEVDRSGAYYVHNPYGSQPTADITAIASGGTYSVSAFTTTEDSLSVSDHIAYGEHIYGFERLLSSYDLYANRMRELSMAMADKIDHFVLNALCEDATGTYPTPAGGFTTAANVATIFSNLISKVAGYRQVMNGMFIILENTDITGLIQTQISSGFSYADAALKNGLIGNYIGVDIYVVRSGRFVDATIGSKTVTNSGHRVFGIKKVATYATPRNLESGEKAVTGKTGMEIYMAGTIGFKLWAQMTDLCVDITIV